VGLSGVDAATLSTARDPDDLANSTPLAEAVRRRDTLTGTLLPRFAGGETA